MKKTLKLTGSLLITHLSAVFISLILGVALMAFIKEGNIGSIITSLIYFSMLYSSGWNEGFRDSRKVGESFPNVKRAVIVGAISCVVTAILLIARIVVYKVNPTDWAPRGAGFEMVQVKSGMLVLFDAIYRVWNFYFVGFMNDQIFVTYLIPIVFPVVFYPIGYIVGLTRFSIIGKYMPQLLYKPKKKKR